MHAVLDVLHPILPQNKPRYLMGVGAPEDLVNGVMRGVDIFDCVLPTRHGPQRLRLCAGRADQPAQRPIHAAIPLPLTPTVPALLAQNFSRAYLRHLVKANEILGHMLLSTHNLHFLLSLMDDLRKAIRKGSGGRVCGRVPGTL
jgi:queuine tRNA-ribosyltransferase